MKLSDRAVAILCAPLGRHLEWQTENDASAWAVKFVAERASLIDYPGLSEYDFPSGASALADLERRLTRVVPEFVQAGAMLTVNDLQQFVQTLSGSTFLCEPYAGPEDPRHEALAAAGLV